MRPTGNCRPALDALRGGQAEKDGSGGGSASGEELRVGARASWSEAAGPPHKTAVWPTAPADFLGAGSLALATPRHGG